MIKYICDEETVNVKLLLLFLANSQSQNSVVYKCKHFFLSLW